jgi:hypothetical protein
MAAALNVPDSLLSSNRIEVGTREQADPRRRAADVRKHRHGILRSLPSDYEGDRRVELSLTLAEHEMRETELEHEQQQMKAE